MQRSMIICSAADLMQMKFSGFSFFWPDGLWIKMMLNTAPVYLAAMVGQEQNYHNIYCYSKRGEMKDTSFTNAWNSEINEGTWCEVYHMWL